MKPWFYGLLGVGMFLGMAAPAQGQPTYTFTTVDPPGSLFPDNNPTQPTALGINAAGQIVGYYNDPLYNKHGFLLDQGSYSVLDVPASNSTTANGINDAGQIVGAYFDAAKTAHGFLLDQGSYTTLDVPGATQTFANGIN